MSGKVAVVTGASEGIGLEVVRRLVAEGMKVAALARRTHLLSDLEQELTAKGQSVKCYTCDVRIDDEVKTAFEKISEELGAVSVLVNNAGIAKTVSLKDINIDDVRTMLDTNIIGVLSCTREYLALMNKHSSESGHIIVINSVAGHRPTSFETMTVYASTKRAITSLCDSLRTQLGSSNIRVTSISPGLVKTGMTASFLAVSPTYPHLLPEDVADAVSYAISVSSRFNVSEIILDTIVKR